MPDKNITIHRGVEGDDPVFISPRSAPQDRSLSWEARGVLWYLLSKPGDWTLQPTDLQQECGRDKVYKILNELIKRRYILRTYTREKGIIRDIIYEVFAQPRPATEKPYPANPHITVTDNSNQIPVTDSGIENLHTTADAVSQDEPTVQDDVKSISDTPRNWLFEAVGFGLYRMNREALRKASKQVRARIGNIATGSKKRDDRGLMGCFFPDGNPTDEQEKEAGHELLLFFKWWREKKPGIDPPASSGLIWLRLNDYRATLLDEQSPVPSQPKPRNPDGTFVDGSPFEPFQSWPSGKWITEPIRHATPDYSVTTRVTNRLQPAQVIDPNDIDLDTF